MPPEEGVLGVPTERAEPRMERWETARVGVVAGVVLLAELRLLDDDP
jgi:hypothetical protein